MRVVLEEYKYLLGLLDLLPDFAQPAEMTVDLGVVAAAVNHILRLPLEVVAQGVPAGAEVVKAGVGSVAVVIVSDNGEVPAEVA